MRFCTRTDGVGSIQALVVSLYMEIVQSSGKYGFDCEYTREEKSGKRMFQSYNGLVIL